MDSNLPISDNMVLVFSAIAMICIALILLIICVVLLSKISKQTGTSGSNISAFQKGDFVGEPSLSVEDGIGDEVVAVIAAAIAAFSSDSDGKSYAVRSIKKAKAGRPIWAAAGLQENTHAF